MWLILTGLSIGAVCSVKWVGLFVTAVVGLYTVSELWEKLGDVSLPKKTYTQHWLARIACLIFIPVAVYVAAFKAHFMILNHTGSGDAQMSSLFQANLKGNKFYKSPLEIAYGSKVTLKQMGYGGGLLHSHVQNFPLGSLEGQVTCYHYQDDNNQFNVLPSLAQQKVDEATRNAERGELSAGEVGELGERGEQSEDISQDEGSDKDEIRFLHSGDIIRLQHVPYSRYIHAHDLPAPLSRLDYEVAAFSASREDDTNDNWIVEPVDDVFRGKLTPHDRIHSLTTRLRFRHRNLGCYLRAANRNLPEWGFKQVEVTCTKENDVRDDYTHWNVESHWNDRLPRGKKSLYRTNFLKDFWHLNIAMMMSNNALIPNPDKADILASKPTDWPFLRLGLRMNGWSDHNTKYYLIGNPVVWWCSSVAVMLFVLISGYHVVCERRRVRDVTKRESKSEWDCKSLFIAHTPRRRTGPLYLRRYGRIWRMGFPLHTLSHHGPRHVSSSLPSRTLLCSFGAGAGARSCCLQAQCVRGREVVRLCSTRSQHSSHFLPLPRRRFRHGRSYVAPQVPGMAE